jgi:hypothetical protein
MSVLRAMRPNRTQHLSLEWSAQIWFSHEVHSSHGCISNTSTNNTIKNGDWEIFASLNYFTNDTKNDVISLNTHVKISTSYTINSKLPAFLSWFRTKQKTANSTLSHNSALVSSSYFLQFHYVLYFHAINRSKKLLIYHDFHNLFAITFYSTTFYTNQGLGHHDSFQG